MKIIELNTNEYEKLVKKGLIEEDKKIEKIDVIDWNDCIHGVTHTEKRILIEINKIQTKFNEIIDKINSLEDK